jgi:two-component system nitrogen regulation sensor histidine kinase GlnL
MTPPVLIKRRIIYYFILKIGILKTGISVQNNLNKICYMFTTDKQLRITSWSEEAEAIFKKSSSEVNGIPYCEITPKIQKDGKDALAQALKHGKSITLKGYRVSCFYGCSEADVRITPLKDRRNKVCGTTVSIEATPGCIVWERLKQSERFIDIGKISATFAHGIRSPLNAIKGAVVYLREKYASEKKLIEFTRIIEEEILRLDNFIAKFLSTAVSDQGLSEANLKSVLKKIEVLTSLQAQSRNIRTFFENDYVPPVLMDSFHLEHAILNVINNAIDAMPSGGTLSVKTLHEGGFSNEFAVIAISDTGCGLTGSGDENAALSSRKEGKGLGLFITREILRSFGGHLEIKSLKDRGTTVKLYIPGGPIND